MQDFHTNASAPPFLPAPDDLTVLLKILGEQQNGINHLTALVKKDAKELEIIRSVDAEEKAARQIAG